MNKIDNALMTLFRQVEYHFKQFLYYFMFRDIKNCKGFCPTCKYFDECMEHIKLEYKSALQKIVRYCLTIKKIILSED